MSCKSSVPSRPKIMFFGDPHGDFRFVIRSVEQHAPEAIIVLGDIQARRPLQTELEPILDLTEVLWIPGNHDTDTVDDHDNLFLSSLADRNLHGRVLEVAGLRVAGLGGVFRETIWAPPLSPQFHSIGARLRVTRANERWRGGLPLRHRSSIFPDVFERLSRRRADVLVTHEAFGGHPRGWPMLNELALSLGVQVAVHGHLHRNIDYRAEGRLPPGAPYEVFGVAQEFFLTWPRSVRQFVQGVA